MDIHVEDSENMEIDDVLDENSTMPRKSDRLKNKGNQNALTEINKTIGPSKSAKRKRNRRREPQFISTLQDLFLPIDSTDGMVIFRPIVVEEFEVWIILHPASIKF